VVAAIKSAVTVAVVSFFIFLLQNSNGKINKNDMVLPIQNARKRPVVLTGIGVTGAYLPVTAS